MSLNYTVGDWTVKSNEVDSISTPKTLSLPDLSYSADYSVASSSGKETRIINTTGATLEPVEKLRYAKERVADIYRTVDTLKANQLPSTIGTRVLGESIEILSADNSVSGAGYEIPIRTWTVMESSTHNAITGDALLWALLRHVAALFPTGSVTSAQLIKLFRGDLDPTQ
jgi:hypothetical protein